jgi:hypothetical protein
MPNQSVLVKKRTLLLLLSLLTLILLNIFWKMYLDEAKQHIFSYVAVIYHAQLSDIQNKIWWKFFLPMPEMNEIWATTGILAVYGLDCLFGSAVTTYYFVTSLCVLVTFAATKRVFHSLTLSFLVGFCFALTTYNYHAYRISGGVIFPLIICWVVFFSVCQYELFQERCKRKIWIPLYYLSLFLYAISYESWLDYVVFQCIIYPILGWQFLRRGDLYRFRVARFILVSSTITAIIYIMIKVWFAYTTLHSPGLEADLIFNYPLKYLIMGVEDVINNIITSLFMTVTTYLPPTLFNFSVSSWFYGGQTIVQQQNGYDPNNTYLVAYSAMFMWRYYAGIAFTLFTILYMRVIKAMLANFNSQNITWFVLMTLTFIGSPTHELIKMRPMNTAPLLGYHVYTSVTAYTLLLCLGVWTLSCRMSSIWKSRAVIVIFCLNVAFCALMRPSLLSHMASLVGWGSYPQPWINLKHLFF